MFLAMYMLFWLIVGYVVFWRYVVAGRRKEQCREREEA